MTSSSLLLEKETILWEQTQRFSYSYDKLDRLWDCESKRKHENVWGDSGLAYGAFQWHLSSWVFFNNIFQTNLNIESFTDQVEMTIMVLQQPNGWRNWYNCFKENAEI